MKYPPRRRFTRRVAFGRLDTLGAMQMSVREYSDIYGIEPGKVFRAAMFGMLNASFNTGIMLNYDASLHTFAANHERIKIPEHSFFMKKHCHNGVAYWEFILRIGSGAPFASPRRRRAQNPQLKQRGTTAYLKKQMMKAYCCYLTDSALTHIVSANKQSVLDWIDVVQLSSLKDDVVLCT